MKNFTQYDLTFYPFNVDLISGMLWELNISGIQEQDNYIQIYVEENKITSESIEVLLRELIKENLIESYSINSSNVENKNWNEEWEKNLSPIEVTDRIVVKPSFKDYETREDQIELIIDPKMSFGTGEHQTTKLMLQLLEKYIEPGMRVLDVGSGTGILAIAAAKLGATEIIAFDNDELCYDNGLENVRINDAGDKVDVRIGEISSISESEFDLIVANVNKHILMDIAGEISARLKKNGVILLSGLLFQDRDDIEERYKKKGQNIQKILQLDEWIALVLRN